MILGPTTIKPRIEENLHRIRERIARAATRSGRDVGDVRLVVVTKSAGLDAIGALLDLGFADLGENRVQQLVRRAGQIAELGRHPNVDSPIESPAGPRWHMIGRLQRNKVKMLLPHVAMIQSVDSLRLADEICKHAQSRSGNVDLLLEVNGGDEAQKVGTAVAAAAHLGEQVASMPNVHLRGLMTMAPYGADEPTLRYVFGRVADLFDEMRRDYDVGDAFDTLSMGMSDDFEIAVACGANMVRIGSAVFEGIDLTDAGSDPAIDDSMADAD